MTAHTLPPWTQCEFLAALVHIGGWRRLPGPARLYRSPQGRVIDLDELCGNRPLWLCWAALRELPPKENYR